MTRQGGLRGSGLWAESPLSDIVVPANGCPYPWQARLLEEYRIQQCLDGEPDLTPANITERYTMYRALVRDTFATGQTDPAGNQADLEAARGLLQLGETAVVFNIPDRST